MRRRREISIPSEEGYCSLQVLQPAIKGPFKTQRLWRDKQRICAPATWPDVTVRPRPEPLPARRLGRSMRREAHAEAGMRTMALLVPPLCKLCKRGSSIVPHRQHNSQMKCMFFHSTTKSERSFTSACLLHESNII